MSENIPFGTPLEGPSDPGDAFAPREDGGGRRRTLLIAAGSAVALAAAGVAALVLTGGGSDEPTPFTMPTPRHSTSASSPTSTATLSLLPTEAAVNARNPFLRVPSDNTSSGSGTGGASGGGTVSTVTATKTVVSTGANKTVKSTSTVKSTVTAPSTAVYLALFSVAGTAGNQAVFQVASGSAAGVRYQVTTAHDFGPNNVFTYTGTTTLNSVLCADVTYVDEAFTICPGDMNKVH